jgi:t-SNARE complex subunit (syntaxin)
MCKKEINNNKNVGDFFKALYRKAKNTRKGRVILSNIIIIIFSLLKILLNTQA